MLFSKVTSKTPYYHTYGNQSACDITNFCSVNMDVDTIELV